MKIETPGIIGMVFASIVGAGYVVTGNPDFEAEVKRPLPEVYAAFSEVRMIGSGLRDEGFNVPKITTSRPSAHELVFTAPSANPDQITRIAFTFEQGQNSVTTRVIAAIDVPPIPVRIDGQDKFLSEDKVEARFKEAIGDLAKRLNDGNSTTEAGHKMAMLLDMVAMASHPAQLRAMADRVEAQEAEVNAIKKRLENQGYKVRTSGGSREQKAPQFDDSADLEPE